MESVISRIIPGIWLMLSPFAVFFVFVVASVLLGALKWSSPTDDTNKLRVPGKSVNA